MSNFTQETLSNEELTDKLSNLVAGGYKNAFFLDVGSDKNTFTTAGSEHHIAGSIIYLVNSDQSSITQSCSGIFRDVNANSETSNPDKNFMLIASNKKDETDFIIYDDQGNILCSSTNENRENIQGFIMAVVEYSDKRSIFLLNIYLQSNINDSILTTYWDKEYINPIFQLALLFKKQGMITNDFKSV